MNEIFKNNKKIIEEEYRNKKTSMESFPCNLEVLISDECNLSCFMCSIGVYKNKFSKGLNNEIYQRLKALFPYLENLKINGAEIFSVPYNENSIVDNIMIAAIPFENMKINGTTNGILIEEKRAEIILKKFKRLELSIDSPIEDIYSSIRIGAKLETFIKNVKTINELKKANRLGRNDPPELNFSTIVMDRTYKDIPDLINLARDLGACSLGLRPLWCDLKEPEWEKIKHEDIFNSREKTEEWKNILVKSEESAKKAGIDLIDTTTYRIAELYPDLIDDSLYEEEVDSFNDQGDEVCSCPWDSIYVGSKGFVSFALCSRMVLGDLNHSRFIDIWNGKVAVKERKRFINNNYSNCSKNCAKNYPYAGTIIYKDDLITKIRKKFSDKNV